MSITTSPRFVLFIVSIVIVIPVSLFICEFLLCRRESAFALVLPIATASCFIFVGVYAFFIAAIMFGIYFIMKYMRAEKIKNQSELTKMNIQDLE